MSDIAVKAGAAVGHYRLQCLSSNVIMHDQRSADASVFPLVAPGQEHAFLRTHYDQQRLTVGDVSDGLFRFAQWLPVVSRPAGSGAPVTYHARQLGRRIGLSRLYVTFSGWWPERDAHIPTGTFKENEAYAVYGRLGEAAGRHTLVVASAGNTARAFLRVASENDLPLVVVVPEGNVADLWTVGPAGPSTVVVAVGDGADYGDAIHMASLLSAQPGFLAEGGAKNVARRDGMGTTFLSATTEVGRIPDHYFQAVGSGTGAIAAWEAMLRLVADGRYGSRLSRLHLAQNAPFQVLVDSWNARSRTLVMPDETTARRQIDAIGAKVLANRHPPWSPAGGLFDALTATNGAMYAVTNGEADAAAQLFETSEGIDLSPAAAVACGAMVQAVESGAVRRDDIVNLNVTGGGYRRARQELDTRPLRADITVGRDRCDGPALAERIETIRRERAADPTTVPQAYRPTPAT